MPDVSTEIRDWIVGVGGFIVALVGIGVPIVLDRRRKALTVTASAPATGLPAPVTLVDREPENAQLERHLASGERVIIVDGGRGNGKSALVLWVAHSYVAGRGKRGGKATLFWLDAGNDCPDIAELARQVGLYCGERTLTIAPMAAKEHMLRSFLEANPKILIVDDLRVGSDGSMRLREFFESLPAGSRVIVSANTVGMLSGPRVTVPELAEQHARTLITREAARCGIAELAAAASPLVDRVYRLFGGNPRAITLFIAACTQQPGTVAELLDTVEAGGGRMDTLYGAVWAELAERAKATLSLCAVLRTAAPSQVAIALDLTEAEAKDELVQLWQAGLIGSGRVLEQTVYRCPAALRTFVLDHADAARLGQRRDRLATSLTEKFTREPENAAAAASQADAIRTLIQELHIAGQHRLCVDLFAAVYDLLFTLGLFDDRITLGWVACAAAGKLGSAKEQSLALSVVSSTHAIRGEDAEAAHAVRIGMEIARNAGIPEEIARQLRCEAFRLYRAGRVREALDLLLAEDAEGMARDAGDPHNMIDILSLIAAAQFHLGDYEACAATARRELAECERLPWERGKAYPLRDLADALLMLGERQAAEDLAARAKAIAIEYEDIRQVARIGLTEARLHLFAGRMRQARAAATRAAAAAGDLVLPGEQAESLAVATKATRCLWLPWLRWWVTDKPRNRFTDWTIGGD